MSVATGCTAALPLSMGTATLAHRTRADIPIFLFTAFLLLEESPLHPKFIRRDLFDLKRDREFLIQEPTFVNIEVAILR